MEISEEIIFGKHAVVSFLKRGQSSASEGQEGIHINRLLLMQGAKIDAATAQICDLAKLLKIRVNTISRKEFEQKVGTDRTHQGVALVLGSTPILQMQDFLELLSRVGSNKQMIVLLDGIEDPHNLGAIIRSAEASGALALFIPRHRSASITGTVAKTSAGASALLPIVQVTNLTQTIELLKKEDFWIVGLDGEAKQDYTQVDLTRRVAIVIGAEGKGISRLVAEHCDFLVHIPMLGQTESLNASVAAGIMFYEVVRQNRT